MIQPENREINRFRRMQFNNFAQITIPYLAAFVDENDFEIRLVDEYNQRIPYHRHFDLVAITVNTPNASHCYAISARFRAQGAKTVMGGPHATLLPDEVCEHCDFLLIGESEETWTLFLSDFINDKPRALYRSITAPLLENLPFPRWDLLKRNRLMKGAVFATRGCPHHCRYCNLKQIYHPHFRTRPIEEVIHEIKRLRSKFFVFWDDNLFADKEHAKKLLQAIKPLKRKWAAQVTLHDCADDELLKLAKSAGCLYLFIGLESFSENSLSDAGKSINQPNHYKTIIDLIHRNRIMIQAGIVFGFDSDTKTIFNDTLAACEQLGIDGTTVSILTPLPKTPVYEQLKTEGRLLHENWKEYNGKTAVTFQPKNMSTDELWKGYIMFRKRFYTLSSFIRRINVSRTNRLVNFIMNLGYRLGV